VSSLVLGLTRLSGVAVSLPNPVTLLLSCKSGEQVIINVEWQCTGILSTLLFFALVMATPHVGYGKKIKTLIIGEPIFFFLNIFRLYFTILCGYRYGLSLMNFLHKIMWEIFTPTIVMVAWLVWLRLEMKSTA
jgi:exosortase/archaeosortase family protein